MLGLLIEHIVCRALRLGAFPWPIPAVSKGNLNIYLPKLLGSASGVLGSVFFGSFYFFWEDEKAR